MKLNQILRIVGLIVFTITAAVYVMTAERVGSLWDCGEFILGAHKLQVVHPPGAPLFLLVGRIFAWLGDITSSDPANIALAVNFMSALCTAMAATFVAWITTRLSSKLWSNDIQEEGYDMGTAVSLLGGGVVAGLATAFASSIWFSAVEGEVYAMSTLFTSMTVWAVVKWYTESKATDKWLVFACYSAGLSIGVHLLSLLTFPALAIFVYLKKSKKTSLGGIIGATALGAVSVPLIQKFIIAGIPAIWQSMDLIMVNSFGLPYHSGIIPTLLILAGGLFLGFRYAKKKGSRIMELIMMSVLMITIGYSTFGMVVIRANADTPVNMNVPSDATRLLPYLNREQYGERPLAYGPHYEASPVSYDREIRKGRESFPPHYDQPENSEYVVVDEKIKPQYRNSDKMLFPRIAHAEMGRPALYRQWYQYIFNGEPKPSFAFNIAFFMKYQLGWVYTRYFMWNFVGRQNGSQGYYAWDKSSGHWSSGIKFIDEMKLYNMDQEPDTMKNHEANNNYYFLPFIFGLIGLLYHAVKKTNDFYGLLMLFLITGIGIIIYTNSPPNEPRERDYVFIGSFFTFCMWMGMAVPALYRTATERFKFTGAPAAGLAAALVLSAPIIMGFQNYDDHDRSDIQASRDYASNFLNSLQPNSILFTYGDNDTYPLWYAQEVEGIRTDVRIVNLSLIAVDWYINKLRRKVNDSEALKLTIPASSYRGNKRNQVPFYDGGRAERPIPLVDGLRHIGGNNQVSTSNMTFESYVPSHEFYIPTNYEAAQRLGMYNPADSIAIESEIRLKFAESKSWLTKDDLAIMDVIASNIWERPVYFATTCKNEKLLGLNDYMQYEGLALRIVPIKTPSDRSLSIYGSGRVASEIAYDNIMNKFKWGNFDKYDLHVDNSYGAAVQAHRMVMMRTAETLLSEGKRQKVIDIVDKYFEAFPHMNFAYDASTTPFINLYIRAGALDKAKEHALILARETADYLEFYNSIDPNILQSSFAQDNAYRQRTVNSLNSIASSLQDPAFKQQVDDYLSPYITRTVPN